MIWLAQEIWPSPTNPWPPGSPGRGCEQWDSRCSFPPGCRAGQFSIGCGGCRIAGGSLQAPKPCGLRIPPLDPSFCGTASAAGIAAPPSDPGAHHGTLQGPCVQLKPAHQTGHRLSLNQIREAYREQA